MPSSASPPSTKSLSKDDLPPPQPRPPRPPNRSSFDLEPNPFEQSFSRSEQSDDADKKTDDHPKPKPETPKPTLPSLAALSSPSDGSYSWTDLAGSLRSGPLSPAMLQGPQQPQQQQQRMPLSSFDSAPFRTGLTPSTGLTPIVGGPVSFPPPSPNTAAFLAMVTSNNNNTAQATITPNTLSAITGMMHQSQPQQPAVAPSATTSAPANPGIPAPAPYAYNPQQQQQQPNGYAPTSAANAANAAANGLFLLSQAHQELTKREEAQARAGGAGAPSADNPKRGSKRKSLDGPAPAPAPSSRAPASKRARPASQRRRKASTGSPDDDDSPDEDDMREAAEENDRQGAHNGSKKPETEEEKRRNFLERNRQAALKCRQRKKAWLAQLQAKVEFLTNENDRLTNALVSSREEISRLNALLGAGPPQNGAPAGSQPVSVSVSLPPAAKSVAAPSGPPVSVVGNGRGYGY